MHGNTWKNAEVTGSKWEQFFGPDDQSAVAGIVTSGKSWNSYAKSGEVGDGENGEASVT